MDKNIEPTEITTEDVSFMEAELAKTVQPLSLSELSRKLAYLKTAGQLGYEVKRYDPNCRYEVNDLIYKTYDEPLTVSSKGVEHFKGAIVLKVVGKVAYESFNCEMLEVDYTGGGPFRKHVDYMKKTKTQVLLPSNMDGKGLDPEVLKKEEDPRRKELPITERDLSKLQKNLRAALAKSEKFFNWNDHWQLTDKQVQVSDESMGKIEEDLNKSQRSAATADLVSKYLDTTSDSETFPLSVMSLNAILDKKHKKSFVFVSPENGGRWILRSTLDGLLKGLPLSTPKAKLPDFEEIKKPTGPRLRALPVKLYLTWREILSGGLKIPDSLRRELSASREYVLTNADEEKDYTVYYYPSQSILLGLQDYYTSQNIPQGASLTLVKKNDTHLVLSLKKSKKKIAVPTVTYNAKKDVFSEGGEVFTFALPNKIIFLEADTLSKLVSLSDQRDNLDLRDLLVLVFKEFGLKGDYFSLHFRRAFHLVDMIKHTILEDVEKTLLSTSEFARSEKKKGLFFYTVKAEPVKPAEPEPIPVVRLEKAAEPDEEEDEEALPEIGTVGEVTVPDVQIEEVAEPLPQATLETRAEVEVLPEPEEKIIPLLKEEKAPPPKKKTRKIKAEAEGLPRKRRREKKQIEERIEVEEFEMEALIAKKAQETEELPVERAVAPKKEKKIEYKPTEEEKLLSGLFAEKLKSALDKKKTKKDKKKK